MDESPFMILKTIEARSDIKFNFLKHNLPNETFTCSIDRDVSLMIQGLSILFDRKITSLGDGVFAIGKSKNDESDGSNDFIEAHLIDRSTNEPIIGATLLIPSLDYGDISDIDGRVKLEGFFADSDLIEIQYLGYETLVMTIAQLREVGVIEVIAKEHVLDDIVIKSHKNLSSSNLTGDIIDPETIDLPSAPDRDVFAQAQMIPGVYNSSESLQDLQIRGGPPDQVSYNWNNMRLFQNSLFYGRVSAVNPFMVDQINITRNGASSDENASASGAINLKTDLSNVDTTSAFAHVNGLYGNMGLQTSLFSDVLKIKGAFRKSLSGVFQSGIFDKYFNNSFQFGRVQDIDYYLDLFNIVEDVTIIPAFSFQDMSLTAQIELGKDSYVKGSMINFGNEFTYNQIKDYSPKLILDSFTINTVGYSFEWQQKITNSLSSSVNLGTSDYNYMYLMSNDKRDLYADYLTQDNSVVQSDVRVKLNWERKMYSITAGYDLYDWHVIYDADSSRPEEDWFRSREDAKGREHSGFFNLQINTHPWYRILVGMRGSSYSLAIFSRNIYEPRIHASIFANDNLTLHAHYGKFHQNLNRRKIGTNLQVDSGFWLLSNEGVTTSNYIPIVQSSQISVGMKYLLDNWVFTADAYKKQGNDIWTSAFDFPGTEDLFEFTQLNILGLELSAQYQNSWLSLMWTYDHVNDKITTYNSMLELNSPFTQPHRLSMYQALRHGPWSFSSQVVYASGRFYSTPLSLGIFEKNGEEYYDPIYDNYLDRQVPDYFKVDLGMGYRYDFSKRTKRYLDFKIQLVNVLNRDNIVKTEYYTDYRQVPPEINSYDRKGLPFIFNFSAEVRF